MSAPTVSGFATLLAAEASRVVSEHPELADDDLPAPMVVAVTARDATEAALLTDLLYVVKSHLDSDRGTRERVLRALLPAARLTMSPVVLEQVQRNADARGELAAEFGLLSSTQVANLAGSTASNPAALASRWGKERKVFTVDVDGSGRFPGFQFGQNGRPLPVIAEVLAVVGERVTGWELALWFTGSSGRLGGDRPVDVLDSDPELVVEAAGRLADELLA